MEEEGLTYLNYVLLTQSGSSDILQSSYLLLFQ